jgi:hypothetical protein
MRVATDTIVQSLSSDADALLDYYNEKALQMQAFLRAAEGIRTLDLLHGKQLLAFPECPKMPANQRVLAHDRHDGVPGIALKSRQFRQGTDNERSEGPAGSASSHGTCRIRPGFDVREPDSWALQ